MISSDIQLKQHIEDELGWEPSVNAAAIGVAVQEAVVTLSGHVESYRQKHAAAEVVTAIRGVRGLANELDVNLPIDSERSDEDIVHTIASIFVWNISIPQDRIKVQVAKGWVTLEGSVDRYYQRLAAEAAVKDLMGVKGISNLIAVAQKPVHRSAKKNVEAALKRNATANAGKVRLDISGNTLILSGIVPSLTAGAIAEYIAWKTPGVTVVENKLETESAILATL